MARRSHTPRSSAIERIEWDDESEELTVTFKSGGDYVFEGVPEATFAAFCSAPSAGAFYHSQIKDVFG